jgi:ABC-type nickel/cobalt efflux system permease component RcnA
MRRPADLALGLLLLTAAVVVATPLLAQSSPFGGAPAPSGISGWLLAKQAEFYRLLATTVRAAKTDGTAALALVGISFLYGVFHAAGPGHGKAVISSYLVADGSTYRRGVALSVAAALLQAIVAIAVVGVLAALLGATGRAMNFTVRVIELAAYGLIIAFGLVLAWRKGRAFLEAYAARRGKAHHHDHHGHSHAHGDHHDHAHGPEPAELKGRGWLKRGITAVVAVGLRPCSGAILVLVFALSQGIFLIGVVATLVMALGTAITVTAIATLTVAGKAFAERLARTRAGDSAAVLILGLEVAGALVIVVFGAALITGLMVSERMLPV